MYRAALFVALLLPFVACQPKDVPTNGGATAKRTTTPPKDPTNAELLEALESGDDKGLDITLSDGRPEVGSMSMVEPAKALKLSDAQTNAVLARLPEMKVEKTDEKSFAFRERSLPPPRTGDTISTTFPPPVSAGGPDVVADKELKVLRYSPEGDVKLAPTMSITFNQAMVAVTSHDELAKKKPPVKMTPMPKGRWEWVGTKTVLFKAEGERMPMATEYTVEIPAGTKSATGSKLAQATTFKFRTPPVTVKQFYPSSGPTVRDPLMFVLFDQYIDKSAVLATVKVKSKGQEFATRLATDEEIEADERVSAIAKEAKDGYWLAFKATEVLPGDAQVTVSIGPGTPSEEGPRKTESAYTNTFRTYGPLKVVGHRCGWSKRCRPGEWWIVEFNNPLDDDYDESYITVDPELAGLVSYPSYDRLNITGDTKGRTTYTVRISKDIKDQFGQTLGKDKTISFQVGRADKSFRRGSGNLVSLDPAGGTKYPVYTVNYSSLKVQVNKVEPKDWNAYLRYLEVVNGYKKGTPIMPGKRVIDTTVKIETVPDDMVETLVDLSKAFDDGKGHAVVHIAPVGGNRYERTDTWIQATEIGLDAFVDNHELFGWATSLASGKPMEGVELEILPNGIKATTSTKGLATLQLEKSAPSTNILVGRKGDDIALLPENVSWWSKTGSWYERSIPDTQSWFVFDDRKMYKPKEEIHVKGWVRKVGMDRGGDVEALAPAGSTVSYKLIDSRGNDIAKGTTRIKGLGGFDFKAKIPDAANLGYARIELKTGSGAGDRYYHAFQIQEFRRPEFEVSASHSGGPFTIGESGTATVSASYYAGGALPNAEVYWNVYTEEGSFRPPRWDRFTFGTWRPWWIRYYGGGRPSGYKQHQAVTDGQGEHTVKIDFGSVFPPEPTNVRAEATVYDVNRQAWTSRTNMLVHPSDLYIGLRADRLFVKKGEPLDVEVVVVNQDGEIQAKRKVGLRLSRMAWKRVKGQWKQVEEDSVTEILKSGKEPFTHTFKPEVGGQYRLRAAVVDNEGRANRSELTLWVSGGNVPPNRGVAQQQVTLIPDKPEYEPGETAEVLVMSPFADAEGLLTLRRSGVVHTERFTLEGNSFTLEIPIEESYTPNVWAHVDLVGAESRGKKPDGTELPAKPAYAAGNIKLVVPPTKRILTVTAEPRESGVQPGGQTTVDILVKDAAGNPVPDAEVAVVVVDEAVLSLSGYTIPSPLDAFYFERSPGARDFHQRAQVLLASNKEVADKSEQARAGDAAGGAVYDELDGEVMAVETKSTSARTRLAPARRAKAKNGFKADADMPAAPPAELAEPGPASGETDPIKMREDFSALVLFSPMVKTGADGRASVPVKVADNLTRYRVTAVAAAGVKTFGMGESSITARLPLMVRPSPPRFLNFGDKLELPVTIQNQTDEPMTIDVAVRAHNASITNGAGRRVEVPANDRVEVRFPAAAQMAGTARFQVGGVSGKWSDAAQFELPVWTPATTEAFAVYGEIDEGAVAQPIQPPSGVVDEFGGLEITTSSTAVQALTDSVIYLANYPFGCSEQISSRVMSVAALKDVLDAFDAEGLPEPDVMVSSVQADIERLELLQNSDGGFAFWRRGDESWPYISVHAAHALYRAKSKGFTVEDDTMKDSRRYLRNIRNHIPHWYSQEAKWFIRAYALYTRNLMGDSDPAAARKIIKEAGGVENVPMEALGWMLSVMHGKAGYAEDLAAIHRHLDNRVTETAAAAHYATSYEDGAHVLLHSDRRADAIILEGLIVDQPKSDLIPKIVTGLLAHRVRGHWSSTQENALVLLAMDKYFATYEKATPDFVARVWLGDGYAGDHKFKGRTTERHKIDIPMEYVVASDTKQNLVVSKDGPGRLYYRIGMRYAPDDLKLEAADHGFVVQRAYESIGENDDVWQDDDGTWHVKAGAAVRVRLTMVAPTRRYHVALVDPLPAGLEPQNPELATTGTLPKDPQDQANNRYWWWWGPWYEHQNMRDERVEAFTSLLWGGVYNYSYVARATTPGDFVVPPPKAEEMYHPETFGRGASDRLIVEPFVDTKSASR